MTTIILSHPDLKCSTVNKRIIQALSGAKDITIRHLEELYPDSEIDVAKEQEILLRSDLIIFQFPFYWYSSPCHLKLYQDKVLTYEFAYGQKGDKLDNKLFFIMTSTGGDANSYRSGGRNNYTMSELLRPFQQTAFLTRMQYKPAHVFYNAPLLGYTEITDELLAKVDMFIEEYKAKIEKYNKR